MNRWLMLAAALLVACGDSEEEPLPPDPAVAEVAGEVDGKPFVAADALFAHTLGFVTVALPDFAEGCGPIAAEARVRGASTLTLQMATLTAGKQLPSPFAPGLYRVVGPEDLDAFNEGRLPEGAVALATFERLDDQCAQIPPTEELRDRPIGGFVRIFEADLSRNIRGRVELDFFGGSVVGDFTAAPCAIPVSIPEELEGGGGGQGGEQKPPPECR